jgi:hypothetical protein
MHRRDEAKRHNEQDQYQCRSENYTVSPLSEHNSLGVPLSRYLQNRWQD